MIYRKYVENKKKRTKDFTLNTPEPIRELIDNGKLITLFKKCARQHGLNIK